jgi:hypothetical protein
MTWLILHWLLQEVNSYHWNTTISTVAPFDDDEFCIVDQPNEQVRTPRVGCRQLQPSFCRAAPLRFTLSECLTASLRLTG